MTPRQWKAQYPPELHRMGHAAENLARHALALAWCRDPDAAAAKEE